MKTRGLVILCLCLLLLASCASSGGANAQATPGVTQPGSNLPSPTIEALPGLLQTEQLLLMTPPPASNPLDLARRFAPRTNAPASPKTPPARHVGEEESFWLGNQDTVSYSHIRARLVYLTPHVYMYVEDGQAFNQTALQLSANTFEQQIYPADLSLAGSTGSVGVDGDAHITVLNAVGMGTNVGGYFSAQDEYPTSLNPYSNRRDMLYMNLDSEIPGTADYAGTLANEFQQLLNWHEHPLTQDWMNEGIALLAQHVNTYAVNGVDQALLKAPDTQLNDWSSDPSLVAAHAGAGYLFVDYFAEHYGGYGVLKELLQDPAPPPTNFDDVLAKHGYTDRFLDVWRKWLVANFVADPSIDGGEYGYPDIHLPGVKPQQVVNSYPFSQVGQVSQYAGEYYDLSPRGEKFGALSIQLSGSPTVRLVGNDPLDATGEWWGNRANNMDSTLTRSIDLSALKGQRVTLQFATWFDLETNHDYAYVEVSTDNGAHWTSLKGKFTSGSNPIGENLGNGYTGMSGGGAAPAWLQESIDLTPYAGKKIQLRFEEITDNALALQGFAIAQIRIPELGFQDNAAASSGWISEGFVHTQNVLPERYLVQAIVYSGSTFALQTMNVDLASAQGSLVIADFGKPVTRVVLIVAAYAPDTTLQAHYKLEIHVS
jgi:immune inhibitor A